jgi:hypothetical protein
MLSVCLLKMIERVSKRSGVLILRQQQFRVLNIEALQFYLGNTNFESWIVWRLQAYLGKTNLKSWRVRSTQGIRNTNFVSRIVRPAGQNFRILEVYT